MTDIITINTAEEILRRFGPDPNEPDPDDFSPTFWESTCEEMLKEEADWQQRGLIFSWIDEKPECVSAIWWDIMGVLPDPDKPCVRRFRLSLPGGGQIRVTENFVPMSSGGNDVICYEPKLRVQAETNTGLHTTDGIVTRPYYEMSAYAAVFPPRTSQAIADRT